MSVALPEHCGHTLACRCCCAVGIALLAVTRGVEGPGPEGGRNRMQLLMQSGVGRGGDVDRTMELFVRRGEDRQPAADGQSEADEVRGSIAARLPRRYSCCESSRLLGCCQLINLFSDRFQMVVLRGVWLTSCSFAS